MILVPLHHVSMKRNEANVRLCSDVNLIRGVKMYSDFLNWRHSKSEVVEDFSNQLAKNESFQAVCGCAWKNILPRACTFLKQINVLKGRSFLTGTSRIAPQKSSRRKLHL